jgi:hypothetical protein
LPSKCWVLGSIPSTIHTKQHKPPNPQMWLHWHYFFFPPTLHLSTHCLCLSVSPFQRCLFCISWPFTPKYCSVCHQRLDVLSHELQWAQHDFHTYQLGCHLSTDPVMFPLLFLWYWVLNSGSIPWAILPVFFVKGFSRWALANCLPGLTSNHDPPCLCLVSS